MFYLITNRIVAQDNATKMYGKHEFQFGYQYSYESVPKSDATDGGQLRLQHPGNRPIRPGFDCFQPSEALPLTGLGIANMYLGAANYGATFARPWVYLERPRNTPYISRTTGNRAPACP